MWERLSHRFARLSLVQRFLLASLLVLVGNMLLLGWWVSLQIESGVAHQSGATAALYVDSFLEPLLQDLAHADTLGPEEQAALDRVLTEPSFGRQFVAFKVWARPGLVLYSYHQPDVGRIFEPSAGLTRAWRGQVVSAISDLHEEENVGERTRWSRLLETYSPVRLRGSDRVIAVVEFYQSVESLDSDIRQAQVQSWLIVALGTIVTYLLLGGLVRRGSDTIARQQRQLQDHLGALTALLAQNEGLHARVRRASARTAELNEQYLRRLSGELHDGPAQELALAVMRLHAIGANGKAPAPDRPRREPAGPALAPVETMLAQALDEIRTICAGLYLPELAPLTLEETLRRVVQAHERSTDSRVAPRFRDLPAHVGLPLKITLYRLVQEALSNSYRHGGGQEQQVDVSVDGDQVRVVVSDRGPGFVWEARAAQPGHLGLASMRERVERLDGVFGVDSAPGAGTRIVASLPLEPVEEDDD